MAKEHHTWEILLAEAKVDHQQTLTRNIDKAEFSQRAEDSRRSAREKEKKAA
jgi:hypothetical protein